MERDDLAALAGLAGFFNDGEPLARGASVSLGADAAHHGRVRRLGVGERVFIADGAGTYALGRIVELAKASLLVVVDDVRHRDPEPAVHLMVPVGDRDRMLWLAEKSVELGATTWRPIMWRRSRSVSPRGEGAAFTGRVRARMAGALAQSHAVWLPVLHPEAPLAPAVSAVPGGGTRLMLDAGGGAILRETLRAPVTLAVGPEGGFEAEEMEALRAADFRRVTLGANVLRFETAAVAALAIVRAGLMATPEGTDG